MAQLGYSSRLGGGGTGTGGAGDVTVAVTIPASSGALFVVIGVGSGSGDSTDSVVLRGTGGGATEATFTAVQTSTSDNRVELWYVHAADLPAAGTYEVFVDFSAVVRAGVDVHECDGELHATTPVRDSNPSGSGAASAVDVEADDLYVVVAKAFGDQGSPDAGLTDRFSDFLVGTGGTTSVWMGVATEEKTGTGTEDADWGTGVDTYQVNASFTPAATGGGTEDVTGTSAGTSTDTAAITLEYAVFGTVTDGATAEEGAEVYLIDVSDDTLYGSQVTDVNGEYRFSDVPAGTYHATVYVAGKAATSQNVTVG